MAIYYARKAGNVNAADVWATTPSGTASDVFSSFTSADTLMANNFTVTLNVNTTVLEVRNDTANGATAGGGFTLNGGVTLTANCVGGAGNLITPANGTNAIVGNVNAAGAGNAVMLGNYHTGTFSVTGSVTASGTGNGIYTSHLGTVNIVGDVSGGNGRAIWFVNVPINATTNITGNVTAANFLALDWFGTGSILTLTGSVTGGASVNAISLAVPSGGATVSVVGTVTGGTNGVGIIVSSTNTLAVKRAKGGPLAASAAGVAVAVGGAASVVTIEELEYGDLGASPVSGGPYRLSDKSTNVAIMYRFGTTKKTLVDANASGLMPTASNVRFGTVYNGGNSTGTMRVPAAGSVALGVPVDNTTGTAALTPAAVWDYLTANANTSGSMGERLKNAATVASVGQALSDALTPS